MPVGKRDFNSSIRKNLLEFCRKLVVKNISFVNIDYKEFELDSLNNNDFCYFDPPYYLGDASYNENNGWDENKEKELLIYHDFFLRPQNHPKIMKRRKIKCIKSQS